jgi:iron complex outermembrane recepter protein
MILILYMPKASPFHRLKPALLAFALFLAPVPGIPQVANPSPSPNATVLSQVTVQGQLPEAYGPPADEAALKTETPLRDIPQSIHIIPQKLIQDQGAVNLDDVVQDVSGVTQSSMDNNGFNNNYVVRGLAVSYYRDGIPDGPTQNGFQRTLTDIQEVEVLKGPGSALFGSGAPGGTFNLISKQPLTVPEYRFTSTFGSFDTYREFLDVTGPLTNQLDYRFIGNYETTSGFRGVGGEMEEVLPSIIWRPADNQVVTVHFDYRNMRVTPDDVGIPFVGPELLKVPETNTYYSRSRLAIPPFFKG